MEQKLRMSYGSAALNVYDDESNTRLTVDWSYDGLYYRYKNFNDIVVSLGSKTIRDETFLINTPYMITNFKLLCIEAIEVLKKHNYEVSNKVIPKLQEVVDYFV